MAKENANRQITMKVENYTDFRKLSARLVGSVPSIRALCSGGNLPSYHLFFPLVPTASHWSSNSLTHAATCSGATMQQYDTQPLKLDTLMRHFGCRIANTKEEDVLIEREIYIKYANISL